MATESKLGKRMRAVLEQEPDTQLVKNRNRTIRHLLKEPYHGIIENISKPVMLKLIHDIVYLDRKHRSLTEGKEGKLKQNLSDQWQVDNGYMPGFQESMKLLDKLTIT